MQCIVTYAAGNYIRSYLISVLRHKCFILDTFNPDILFTSARMWGFVIFFETNKGREQKGLGNNWYGLNVPHLPHAHYISYPS